MACTVTFRWKAPSEWEPLVTAVIPTAILPEFIILVREHKEAFHYEDDTPTFRTVYSKIGCYDDLIARLPSHLRNAFDHVRMFHCCRPINTKSYYEHGIKILNPQESDEHFRSLFLENPEFPEITAAHIEDAINAMKDSTDREGRVCFGLDDRFLIEYCGHYLIYGSEYLQCLVAHTRREFECLDKGALTRFGIPTVMAIDVPITCFSDSELSGLGEEALYTWAYRLVHGEGEIRMIDFTLSIDHGLPPMHVKEHYHPECVPDPDGRRSSYCYKTARDA